MGADMKECKINTMLTTVMFVMICAVSAAENLIPNPSFELETNNEPDSWSFRAWHDTLENSEKGIDASGRTGKCVYIGSIGDNGVDAAWAANVEVQPYSTYRLSAWIKTDSIQGATGAFLIIQNMQSVKSWAGSHLDSLHLRYGVLKHLPTVRNLLAQPSVVCQPLLESRHWCADRLVRHAPAHSPISRSVKPLC